MSALSEIISAGFDVTLMGDGFEISPASNLTLPQREFLKLHRTEIIAELQSATLSAKDQQKILNWLNSIDEIDSEIIDETIQNCKNDPETLGYFLQRAEGLARPH
jgi:hypothetical protein